MAYQQQSEQRAQELESLQQDVAAKVQDRQRWEERCQQAEAHGAAAEAKHLQAKEGRAKMEEETSGGLQVWVKMAWPAQWILDNFGRFGCFMFICSEVTQVILFWGNHKVCPQTQKVEAAVCHISTADVTMIRSLLEPCIQPHHSPCRN